MASMSENINNANNPFDCSKNTNLPSLVPTSPEKPVTSALFYKQEVQGSPKSSPKRLPNSPIRKRNPGSPIKMPKHTAVYMNPPSAAGVPLLELVRKFEEEKLLSRNDRICINESLSDPIKKNKITKSLHDMELGKNVPFALKRLKHVLYSGGIAPGVGGSQAGKMMSNQLIPQKPGSNIPDSSNNSINSNRVVKNSSSNKSLSSKENNNKNTNDDSKSFATIQSTALTKTKEVVNKVVGENALYHLAQHSPNVCLKIARRLRDFLVAYNPQTMGQRKFAVIVGTGSYNPLTRMHIRMYLLAKQFLESRTDYVVLGSLLSPAHPSLVRQRYRTCPLENMPPLHRLAISQMCVEQSKWMSVDPWEITRRRSMEYSSLLEHVSSMMQHNFPSIDIRVMLLCKSNAIPLISPSVLREGNYGCVSVCRPTEAEQLRNTLSKRWNGMIYIADDTAILDTSLEAVSAKKVRNKLKAGEPIEKLVGTKMSEYMKEHRIREKMLGEEEWEENEKQLPVIQSRNAPALSPTREETDDNSTIATATHSASSSPTKLNTKIRAVSPIRVINLGMPGGNEVDRPASPLTARSAASHDPAPVGGGYY